MRAAAAGLVFCLAVPLASAVKPYQFEDALEGVERVTTAAAVRALAWPFSGSCSDAEPGFDAMQCRVLKRRARELAEQRSYHIEVHAPVRVKDKVVTVHGCFDCDTAEAPMTIGRGAVIKEKGKVLGPVLDRVTRETTPEVAARLMTEIIFSLDGAGRPKLKAHRTYDPCTGEVFLASPPSGERNPSKKCPEKKTE